MENESSVEVAEAAPRRVLRRLGILFAMLSGLFAAVALPANATTNTTVSQVFTGLQGLFTGSLVPAVVIFFAAKIALVMATAWAGHIATSRKSA